MANKITKMDQIAFGAKCELARRDLWQYCHLMDPKFYADDIVNNS